MAKRQLIIEVTGVARRSGRDIAAMVKALCDVLARARSGTEWKHG